MSSNNSGSKVIALPSTVVTRRVLSQVIFDLAGVLYDDAEWKRWLFGRVARMGQQVHYQPFIRLWDGEFQRDVWSGRREFWVALKQFLCAAGLTAPQVEELAVATRAKLRYFDARIRPFSGVRRTLHRLAAWGIEVVIVSRAPRLERDLRQTLNQLDLGDCRARLIATCDLQVIDNAGNYFRWLIQQLDCSPQKTAYVGRDGEDLAAAARLGILTLAFNHDPAATSNIHLEQFDQLLEIAAPSGCSLLAAG
jgi:phosphoglycolate phosphatase-like HAD superfamily hydrolase